MRPCRLCAEPKVVGSRSRSSSSPRMSRITAPRSEAAFSSTYVSEGPAPPTRRSARPTEKRTCMT